MEEQLTNLKNFLIALPHRNNVIHERAVAVDAIMHYIEALFGELTATEAANLDNLLNHFFYALEDEYGRII